MFSKPIEAHKLTFFNIQTNRLDILISPCRIEQSFDEDMQVYIFKSSASKSKYHFLRTVEIRY